MKDEQGTSQLTRHGHFVWNGRNSERPTSAEM